MLILTVLQGPDKGRRFEFPDDEPQQIGRSAESLPLTDQTISRRHAELTPDDGDWLLRDLGSSNGTFVNGVRLTKARKLQQGDQVRTGMTLMVFGEDRHNPHRDAVQTVGHGEIDVSLEASVAANDDSMIMSVPEPDQSAVFQLKVIYQLTGFIGNVTDKQDLFEKVMDVVFGYFQADRGFILVRDSDDEDPEPVVVRHRMGSAVSNTAESNRPITVSRTIVRYVMGKGVGVLSSNAMNDTRFSSGDSVQAFGIRSAMCVPIKFKNRIYGVIYLDSKIANYTYTEDQLTLLTAIGIQTGLALANMRLTEARIKAERLAAVGQTVASLSHSIKNIVQGLRGGGEVVELGLRKQNMKVVNGGWEIVSRNLERVSGLAMNMLAYSKQRKPDFELANLTSILEDICELTQKQFDQKKVALLHDLATDIPPVPMDSGGIHQAVLNLVSNALDASEPEEGVVSVRSVFDEKNERVMVIVADNGHGMSQSFQKRLFEPFNSTKGYGGTGLGLVVTQKVIDEHGGKITVESAEDKGTTITLILPTQQQDNTNPGDTHGHQPNPTPGLVPTSPFDSESDNPTTPPTPVTQIIDEDDDADRVQIT